MNTVIPTHTFVTSATDEFDVETITRTPAVIEGDAIYAISGAMLGRMGTLENTRGFVTLEKGVVEHPNQTIEVDREFLLSALAQLSGAVNYLMADEDSSIKGTNFAFAALAQLESAVGIRRHTVEAD